MKKLNENKKKVILIVLALISIVAITIGVTYAFFNYAKEGTTDNTITSGSIEFLYTENPIAGRGIALVDAIPMSDSDGIRLSGEGNEFNFTITSKTPSKIAIPYEITARRELEENSSDNLDPSVVRIYLAKIETGLEDEQVLLDYFDKLGTPEKTGLDTTIERLLYTGKVPSEQPNYEQHFKLKMWIDGKTEFSAEKNLDGSYKTDGDGNLIYPYNNKKFTIKVNVYANGKALTDSEAANLGSVEIENIYVGNKEDNVKFEEVTGKDCQYQVNLPEGTTDVIINVDTKDEDADVKIEKLDSLAMNVVPTVEKMSNKKTFRLDKGENYFKVTIKSSTDNKLKKEYNIKVFVDYIDWYSKSYGYQENLSDGRSLLITKSGYYILEAWGAQGTSQTGTENGGYGAYATGSIYLKGGQELYIYTGSTTGYNGGGSKTTYSYGTGGGATHIAVDKKLGELQNYSNDKDSLLIVAAGGGSAANYSAVMPGGAGGGYIGGSPYSNKYSTSSVNKISDFGTTTDSQFGKGDYSSGGGYAGGKYYSGGNIFYSGSGGSSYIGNSNLKNKVMYMYCDSDCDNFKSNDIDTKTEVTTNISNDAESNKAKIGNGYAKIMYLGTDLNYDTRLNNIYADSNKFYEVENKNYRYKVVLEKNTTKTNLIVNVMKPSSTIVNVRKTNGDILNLSNEISLNPGNNIFEVEITNNENINTNKIKINIYVIEEDPNNFGYLSTGEQTYPITKTGYYRLEVWGAQGGSYDDTYRGGYGGYSTGDIKLTSGQTLFINVGGAGTGGTTHIARTGGYNGGGDATSNSNGDTRQASGGGATHIALSSGELKTFGLADGSSVDLAKKDDILIVAGGGGGTGMNAVSLNNNKYTFYRKGGDGGGYKAPTLSCHLLNGSNVPYDQIEYGPTQNEGGYASYKQTSDANWVTVKGNALFGKGASGIQNGGGGGWYGGAGSSFSGASGWYTTSGHGCGATGGSGYIANTDLVNKIMYMYCDDVDCINYKSSIESIKTETTTNTTSQIPAESNKARIGNGYARITYIGD